MKTIGIIPARYASTRFPGKPLALLGGRPVIQHVYEQASRCLPEVWVATDDERISDCVKAFGGRVVMTSPDHQSGTDRVCEALKNTGVEADVVVNIQGDEPFIMPEQITCLCECFNHDATQIATLATPFGDNNEAIANANSPKVVTDCHGFALYFSRSIIPFIRGVEPSGWGNAFPFLKHIGIYAYRSEVLKEITLLPQSALEKAEKLEQLRWLENGYRIRVGITKQETIGIDTPADLQRAEAFLKR